MAQELIFIRHAPIAEVGRLCGRTDLPARIDSAAIAAVRATLPREVASFSSPALRCQQTAQALFPDLADLNIDSRLWEQNFGDHDGLAFDDVPDFGILSREDLAAYCPPGGESFADLCSRVWPALVDIARDTPVASTIIVAHAGVIRAALAWQLGASSLGVGFEIAPLSVTRLRVGSEGPISIISVNERPV